MDVIENGGSALTQISEDSYSLTLVDPWTGMALCWGVFSLDDSRQEDYWWRGKTQEQIEG